ncbi:MAG: PAS domain S-box protein, partial [Methanoregula sp.]|nr:PAS domain S-box protein [Methanoregula sp.]
ETRTFMQGTYEAYRYFDTLYYLDKDNRIVQMVPPDVRYMGLDMSNMPSYRMTGEQKNYRISRPFISLRTGNPTVYIIRDVPSGGSIAGELSLDAFQQEITASKDVPGRDFVFILDQYGMLLAHPSPDLVRQQTNQGNLEIFRQGVTGQATLLYTYDGTMVLGSAARVDRTGWVVVDQVPLLAAFGLYALILGLTMGVLILIWLFLAWNLRAQLREQVVRPLEQLSQSVTALAEGDFSKSSNLSPVSGTVFELDRLATDFRHMNNAIQERQTALLQSREELLTKNEEIYVAYEEITATEEELRANYEELQTTEAALRRSENRFRGVAEHIPGIVFQFYARPAGDMGLYYVNERSIDILGIDNTPDDFFPRFTAGIVPEEREKFLASVDTAIREERIWDWEGRFIRSDGRELYLHGISEPVKSDNEQVFSGVLLDITERKRAEEKLKQSERRFIDIINHLPDATFAIDRQGAVIAWNRAMEEMTGVAAGEIMGNSKHEYSIPVYGEQRPLLIDLIFQDDEEIRARYPYVQKKGDKFISEMYIQRLFRGEGAYVWFIASPLYDTGGNIIGAIESIRDVTERKRAEEALHLARRKLNMLNSITFSDIQNAIFSLSGYFELEKMIPMDEKLRLFKEKELKIVQTIAESLKFTSIYQSLGLKPPVWQNVHQSLLMGISHLDISKLSRRLEAGGVEIYADPLLENVFFALAENIVEHGQTATELTICYYESSEGLILFFEDNGTGIPTDLKEKIFEQEYGRRAGLGLFLSREILSITGITIRETGEAGKGARFEITVPKGVYRFSGNP